MVDEPSNYTSEIVSKKKAVTIWLQSKENVIVGHGPSCHYVSATNGRVLDMVRPVIKCWSYYTSLSVFIYV